MSAAGWEADSPCQMWEGAKVADGYGTKRIDGKFYRTHRLAWIMAFGEIPDGLHVLHHCDTPACLNPGHLFLGTHVENMADRSAKGRQPQGENQGRAKLSDEDVREMRAQWASGGVSFSELSRRFGVSKASARRAVLGLTWKCVK